MKTKIRKAKLADAKKCLVLTKTPEFIFPGGDKFVEKYLADFINKGIFFVAEEESEIIGFISAQITLGKELWIDMIVVKNIHRSKGIGTKLIKNVLELAKRKKTKMVFLDAPAFNKKTLKFYKKIGLKKEKKFIWFTKEFN
jgi:ribosomal protein S18 acetylase RimI-like enzyme